MSGTRLENCRLVLQEFERHHSLAVQDLLEEQKLARDRIQQDHRLAMRLDRLVETGKRVVDLFDDVDGSRREELDAITGDGVFSAFYDRLKDLRDYHRRNRETVEAMLVEDPLEMKPAVVFTGEEAGGKYLDMHDLHTKYVNMKGMFTKCDYVAFLGQFEKLSGIPKRTKLAKIAVYQPYLEELVAYLMSFHQRIEPLVEMQELVELIEEEFQLRWSKEKLRGWFKPKPKVEGAEESDGDDSEDDKSAPPPPRPPVAAKEGEGEKKDEKKDGNAADDMDDDEAADNPLFCKPCAKLFAKQTVFDKHLTGKKHVAAARRSAAAGNLAAAAVKRKEQSRALALLEFKVKHFAGLLRTQINETRKHLELKQSRTYTELMREMKNEQQEEIHLSSDSEGENKPLSNPLNLPLGWDGKPIPYWLYKLHGLNIEYKCEICGGYSYWGPRAFQRHFREWRHTYGMRCLGIPNTKHFINVTRFQDAIALHKKLQKSTKGQLFKPEEEEEFEDHEGNVFNKKTYDELKKQGVI